MSAHVFRAGRITKVALAGLLVFSTALHAQEPMDFGDAPDPGYPTKLSSNGARHTALKGFHLGAVIDTESDGTPNGLATGDDDKDLDDEDGVTFITALVPGDITTVDIVASAPGLLDAWLDFNRNASWADAGDQIFSSTALAPGTNRLSFPVPAATAEGYAYARFRFSQQGELSFAGPAPDGEVEDYRVLIQALDFGDCPDEPEIEPVFSIEAPSPEPWARFGDAVAVSEDWLLAGAYGAGPGYYGTGAAYLYQWSGSNWVYVQTLTASDAEEDDTFGTTVALEGDWAVIGAAQEGTYEYGAAYVFRWDGATWSEKQKLVASPRKRLAHFGSSVALSGNRLVVGAYWDRTSDMVPMGSATVFAYDGTNWVEQAKLWPSLGVNDDHFGGNVDIDGDWIVVSASGDDHAGLTNAGSAYVFHQVGSNWVEATRLMAPGGPVEDERFGSSVGIAGGHLVVGADNHDVDGLIRAGAAYCYRWNGLSWGHQETLVSPDAQDGGDFGRDVAVHEERLGVGAPFEGDWPAQNGAAYVYEWGGASWVLKQALIAPDPADANQFGRALGLSAHHLAAGAPESDVGTNTHAGVAYAFQWLPDPYDFPTRYVNDGARHRRLPGIQLGTKDTDTESDGLVHPTAQGDDLDGDDDEDGITFLPSVLEPGRVATVRAVASVAGFLSGWIDFNDDGDWDDSYEHVFDNEALTSGVNDLAFTVAPDAATSEPGAPVFCRFRFSTSAIHGYAGYAADGEVEDHMVLIDEFPEDMDFGDAPDGGGLDYATRLASGGAWHEIVAGAPCLGGPPDAEADGIPSGGADGDDLASGDDEDGITFVTTLVRGGPFEIKVDVTSSPAGGYFSAWLDWTADGDWNDTGEHLLSDFLVTAGHTYTLTGTVPPNAEPGPGYARFRISSLPGLGPSGPAADGEVEDYYAPVFQAGPSGPLWITSVRASNTAAEVEWSAEPGVVYQLQVAGDLVSGDAGDWLDLGPRVAGPADSQTDPAATVSSRCYRVVAPWIEDP